MNESDVSGKRRMKKKELEEEDKRNSQLLQGLPIELLLYIICILCGINSKIHVISSIQSHNLKTYINILLNVSKNLEEKMLHLLTQEKKVRTQYLKAKQKIECLYLDTYHFYVSESNNIDYITLKKYMDHYTSKYSKRENNPLIYVLKKKSIKDNFQLILMVIKCMQELYQERLDESKYIGNLDIFYQNIFKKLIHYDPSQSTEDFKIFKFKYFTKFLKKTNYIINTINLNTLIQLYPSLINLLSNEDREKVKYEIKNDDDFYTIVQLDRMNIYEWLLVDLPYINNTFIQKFIFHQSIKNNHNLFRRVYFLEKNYQECALHKCIDYAIEHPEFIIDLELSKQQSIVDLYKNKLKYTSSSIQETEFKKDINTLKLLSKFIQKEKISMNIYLLKYASIEVQEDYLDDDRFNLQYCHSTIQKTWYIRNPLYYNGCLSEAVYLKIAKKYHFEEDDEEEADDDEEEADDEEDEELEVEEKLVEEEELSNYMRNFNRRHSCDIYDEMISVIEPKNSDEDESDEDESDEDESDEDEYDEDDE